MVILMIYGIVTHQCIGNFGVSKISSLELERRSLSSIVIVYVPLKLSSTKLWTNNKNVANKNGRMFHFTGVIIAPYKRLVRDALDVRTTIFNVI